MTPKLRQQILEAASNACDICKITRVRLEVHHRDLNHSNDEPTNHQVLCVPCHKNTHRGLQWSAELNDWDTPYARFNAALDRRWRDEEKITAVISVDVEVFADLQTIALQRFGVADVGRLITYMRLRDHPYLLADSTQEALAS